ncbi:MAG: zinc ribbon domain-containing protein, partial [Anaerolineaceae bacterium]
MAKKSIGYVKLEWVCPNCSTKNPGPQKTCLACGAPQPANVQFIKAVQDVLLSDEKELQQAKAGANVHCPYCGARNQAGADSCSQCGADLAEARARLTGQVLGAFQDRAQTVECPSCQTSNPSDASFCIACGASLTAPTVPAGPAVGESPAASASSANQKKLNPLLIILPAAFVVLACVLFLIFSSKKTDVNAQVI